jgi:hypothetical protein
MIQHEEMCDREALIDDFCSAVQKKTAAVFVGAGISIASGLPSWFDLLLPEARRLGIRFDPGDDPAEVAQYVVNSDLGNRGPFVNRIRAALDRNAAPNSYHVALGRTPLDSIWTTNYDTLIEESLGRFRLAVHASDADIGHPAESADIEIVKIHGCISRSAPEELVLTKEDYEDFTVRRAATADRLRGELLRRSFLFLGYGFADRTINNILVEARRLARRATRRHYVVEKRLSGAAEDGCEARRQAHWAADLRRMGIHCVFVEEFCELGEILDAIALRSRGPTVYVTGSHESQSELAAALGRLLASSQDPKVVTLDGQSEGVSRDFTAAFGEECVVRRIDLRDRLHLFPNPYAMNPAFSNDRSLLPTLAQVRRPLVRAAQVVVVFAGGMGTRMEVELALKEGCRIIPVPLERGDYGDELLRSKEIAASIAEFDPDYVKAVLSDGMTAERLATCVTRGLR